MHLLNRVAVSPSLSTAMLITPLLRMSYAYDRCLIFKDKNARKYTIGGVWWGFWFVINAGTPEG